MWRVGFCRRVPGGSPLLRFLRASHAHCWAARRICRDVWLWVEWTHSGLVLGLAGAAQVRAASLAVSEVHLFPAQPGPIPRPRLPLLAVHSCAALVAHAVGLRVPLATPWRLARALRAAGSRPLLRAEVIER